MSKVFTVLTTNPDGTPAPEFWAATFEEGFTAQAPWPNDTKQVEQCIASLAAREAMPRLAATPAGSRHLKAAGDLVVRHAAQLVSSR